MLAAASVAIGTLPGCAFIFSQGPPPRERQARDTYFDCSDSWVPAIVDVVLATGTGFVAAASYDDRTIANPHGAAAVSGSLAALFAVSAIYGVTSVATCGSAKTARLEHKQRAELLPLPYGVPPWGEPPPYWPPPVAFYRAPAPAVAPKPTPPPEPPKPTPEPSPEPPPAAPVFKPAPPAAAPDS